MQCYYLANMTYEVISMTKELNEAWPILIQLLLHLTDPIELLNTVRQKQEGTNFSIREHIYSLCEIYTSVDCTWKYTVNFETGLNRV